MPIPRHRGDLPYVTTSQMIEVDRAMIEDYHIVLLQMMENAGRNLAHLARARFLGGSAVDRTIVILAGAGGNGGGALVCARRLNTWGGKVLVYLANPPDALKHDPRHQLTILERMGVSIQQADALPEATEAGRVDLVVDGVIGYSLSGSPTGGAAQLIRWASAQAAPILALDVPSGLDATEGTAFDPAIRAKATMTLALPKTGLCRPGAEDYVGELYLADIGVPAELYARPPLCLSVSSPFTEGEVVRLDSRA